MGKLYITVGISGCGKSTYARNFCADNDAFLIDSDEMRLKLYGDVNDQAHNAELFEKLWWLVHEKLDKTEKDVVFCATNLSWKLLSSRIPSIILKGHKIVLVIFNAEVEECRERIKRQLDAGEVRADVLGNGWNGKPILETQQEMFENFVHEYVPKIIGLVDIYVDGDPIHTEWNKTFECEDGFRCTRFNCWNCPDSDKCKVREVSL